MDRVFSHRELIGMASSLFEAGGLRKEDAETVARDLVSAEMCIRDRDQGTAQPLREKFII